MNRSKNRLLRPAYSLAFAIVYMTIILLVASTAMDNVREKLAYYKDMQGPAQARLYAESALELARSALLDGGLGFEKSAGCTPDPNEETDADQLRCGNYTIYSLARQLGGSVDYYIPIPGTGSAAPIGTCSLRDASSFADPGHACNWNKLMFGQSVSIPLFVEDGEGGTLNPSELEMTHLTMTFRTPCKPDADGAIPLTCDAGDRYVLDIDHDKNGRSTITEDNSLVLWQITGKEDIDGNGPLTELREVSLLVDDAPELDLRGNLVRNSSSNTEVYESMVNDGTGSSAVDRAGAFAVIANFLTGLHPQLEEVYLQLDLVYPLFEDELNGAPIPYIEWQISSNKAFPDPKATLLGDGYYESASGIYTFPLEIQVPVTGEGSTLYTVSN